MHLGSLLNRYLIEQSYNSIFFYHKKWPPFLGAIYCGKPHEYLVPANGFELLTFALQVRCSTN